MKKAFLAALMVCLLLAPACLAAAEEAQEPAPLYRAVVSGAGKILDRPDGETVQYVRKGYLVDIFSFDPKYLYVRCYNQFGYLLRDRVENVYPVDKVSTPPYGVEIYSDLSTAGRDLAIWPAPSRHSTQEKLCR